MKAKQTILITGAGGQIGSDLTEALKAKYETVIASDLRVSDTSLNVELDVMDKEKMKEVIQDYGVTQVYHLAAILSATGEKNPMLAWDVNLKGGLNVLELAAELNLNKVFWPSSIAVFGKNTPKENTPQHTITDPDTVYGITKLAGERWSSYYFDKKNVDVRSIRYPGLISYKAPPGGGTTDYAVEIFHEALKQQHYSCFLNKDTCLPMMYMPDAIRATIDLMEAPAASLSIRSSYNVSGMSFTPAQLAEEIQKYIPEFSITCTPDFREAIARSWPSSIDDSVARADWGWKPEYDLEKMVKEMLFHLEKDISFA